MNGNEFFVLANATGNAFVQIERDGLTVRSGWVHDLNEATRFDSPHQAVTQLCESIQCGSYLKSVAPVVAREVPVTRVELV